MPEVTCDPSGQFLTLCFDNVALRFHAIWLRDNARDDRTRAPGNGQKLIALKDIAPDIRIDSATLSDDELSVKFSHEDRAISFDPAWLRANAYDRPEAHTAAWVDPELTLWDGQLSNSIPTGHLPELKRGGRPLFEWLDGVCRFGFGKIHGGPAAENALFEVVDLFGFVRETNYGRLFDVRTEVNPTNLAYTGLGLQAHTDNPYRDPVPSIQVLYCLESTAKGGDNMVVDGFAAAMRLREENASDFDVLTRHCARFEYAGEEGVRLTSRRPMIECAPDGEVIGLRFNNRSLAAVTDVPFDEMAQWYAAYRRLGEIIDDPAMQISFRLEPGEAFVVDNTRVLHARKGYSGEGTRWLQGCYADKDGLRSTRDSLRQQVIMEAAE